MAVKIQTVQRVGSQIESGETSEANIFLDSTLWSWEQMRSERPKKQ
jgi:hypothetical protein